MNRHIIATALVIMTLITGCQSNNQPLEKEKETHQEPPVIKNETLNNEQEDKEEMSKGKLTKNDEVENKEPILLYEKYINVVQTVNGVATIMNPENLLSVVNKQQNLPIDYKPENLVIPNVPFSFTQDLPKKLMVEEAALALEKMFEEALENNLDLYAVSGYRSYDRQKMIFDYKASLVGEEKANEVVAYPGQSEHQTGLAIDISSPSADFELEEKFGDTLEGIWVAEHAHLFGFVIRYQKGKENITGYKYEPWHLRYVGSEIATYLYEHDLTLEEYFNLYEKL